MGLKRGFSSMDPLKQREIASKGGKAAHAKGTAHEFTADEARIAGKKGGAASRERRSRDGGAPEDAPATAQPGHSRQEIQPDQAGDTAETNS